MTDSCIKMGSDESHFNVSLIVRDMVTRQCPQITTFLKRKDSRGGIEKTACVTNKYGGGGGGGGGGGVRAIYLLL